MIQSKICTEEDFNFQWFKNWAKTLCLDATLINRKYWEWVMIAQAFDERGMLKSGKRGLGFGVGISEPLPSAFASKGCYVLATDINCDLGKIEASRVWLDSNANLTDLSQLFVEKICDYDTFNKHVCYRAVDMNHIPKNLRGFDFTWSACSFEHLGSLKNGINFVLNQLSCLKKGGWTAHTTEFTLSSNNSYFNDNLSVTFRRRDIESLIKTLRGKGHYVEELDTSLGSTKADFYVDKPPYGSNPHIRLQLGDHVSTSIILIIRK